MTVCIDRKRERSDGGEEMKRSFHRIVSFLPLRIREWKKPISQQLSSSSSIPSASFISCSHASKRDEGSKLSLRYTPPINK